MTLTTRLTGFFLTALALILAGFTLCLYWLAGHYLQQQVDDQLNQALATIIAAAEVHDNEVIWEPQERAISLGQDDGPEQVRWTVHDATGKLVDRSSNFNGEEPVPRNPQQVTTTPTMFFGPRHGENWQFQHVRLQAPMNELGNHETAAPMPGESVSPAMIMTVGVSLATMEAALRSLLISMSGLSAVLWLTSALLGRWLCRRALTPLSTMAVVARSIQASDLSQRLPKPGTHDELEQLGAAFNDLLTRLQEAFERQRRFTGDASHQLRTPLTIILGQIEVALRRTRSLEDYQAVLDAVHKQSRHLQRIVEMLLFLSRADAEARLPHLESIDLALWLEQHKETWKDASRLTDLCVKLPPPGTCIAEVHASLLGQLVDNLWDNACKYSQPGTPINISLEESAGQIAFSISDAGAGIAPDDLPHLFEPFFRSARARQQGAEGIGLGLAVAQRIATAFHGQITVYSEQGMGSLFTLHLPDASVKRS